MAEPKACTVRTRKFMTNRLLQRKQFVSPGTLSRTRLPCNPTPGSAPGDAASRASQRVLRRVTDARSWRGAVRPHSGHQGIRGGDHGGDKQEQGFAREQKGTSREVLRCAL